MMNKLVRVVKAIQHLGINSILNYAKYQAGLRTGYLRHLTPISMPPIPKQDERVHIGDLSSTFHNITSYEWDKKHLDLLLAEADEICQGKVRLFGGIPVSIELVPPGKLCHWTKYKNNQTLAGVEDIKLIWEPARFGWVFPLGNAYSATQNNIYAQKFWELFTIFYDANPPNLGPNWSSAQEVALRILAFVFASQVFRHSPETTPTRLTRLTSFIADHARRIPPTLSYALAQNNNHLLVEAVGLFTAGTALPDHPSSPYWSRLGWRWANCALQTQIAPDGEYIQHSTNYHRLMLQAALWLDMFATLSNLAFPEKTRNKLEAATRWLIDLLDPISGHVPNLGHNDGANILPMYPVDFQDYRPIVQAASRAFLYETCLPSGPWDTLSELLGLLNRRSLNLQPSRRDKDTLRQIRTIGDKYSWASLRAIDYTTRPAHADQLHVDLWWQGENIALDSGTYQYNASPPWDNALTSTRVHNTVTVDNLDQMTHAGRFLWFDWASARWLNSPDQQSLLSAEHNGYTSKNLLLRRTLRRLDPNHWQVMDEILPSSTKPIKEHQYTVQWLLPDLPYHLEDQTIDIAHPKGEIKLSFQITPSHGYNILLIRAGQNLVSTEVVPKVMGWYSPTYNCKEPALSICLRTTGVPPLSICTTWTFEPRS